MITEIAQIYILPTTFFENLAALHEAAKGGYSFHAPLYGMGVAAFDRHPHAGHEDEGGNWQYTEVGVYPLGLPECPDLEAWMASRSGVASDVPDAAAEILKDEVMGQDWARVGAAGLVSTHYMHEDPANPVRAWARAWTPSEVSAVRGRLDAALKSLHLDLVDAWQQIHEKWRMEAVKDYLWCLNAVAWLLEEEHQQPVPDLLGHLDSDPGSSIFGRPRCSCLPPQT